MTQTTGTTSYVYRADGTKLKKTYNNVTTDYLDGFQYQNGALQFFPTSEGYYDWSNKRYVYNYSDHLGNVRISYYRGTNGGAVVDKESNYYPFGLEQTGYGYTGLVGNTSYNYKYNGKELQETGMYDYGARMYMPDIGRWTTLDPLAEKYPSWSPYVYCSDNPINRIDPDGRFDTKFGPWWHRIWNGGSHSSSIKYDGKRKEYYYNTLNESEGNEVNFTGVYGNSKKSAGTFVFKLEISGSFGLQAGAKVGGPAQASAEAGIWSTDIGKAGWSINDGFYAKQGDGRGHNFLSGSVKVLSKKLSVGGKLDYVTNDLMPTGGDLLDYYPNNGHLEWEANLGPGKSHLSPPKDSDSDILNIGLKSKVRSSDRENCAFCADLGVGLKLILGVDVKLTTGFKGSND